MNRQLVKLLGDAGFRQPEIERQDAEHKFEKLLELIVQECADHINSSSDRYRREYFADKILTHFGIKQ